MARFIKVLFYFRNEGHPLENAVMLSFFFCYYCRLDEAHIREEFVRALKDVTRLFKQFKKFTNGELENLAKDLEVEEGIALNAPLKENIFLLLVAIENSIPIVLTGPPGSSKTLSTRILYKNINNNKRVFKGKPRLILKSYQCSELSTSEGIQKVFESAIEQQGRSRDHRVVVILDEIGLAEKSSSNPLKVLHRLLEPPRVAVIGLSNWSLDPAKMNRMVHASRPPLNE